MEHRFDTEDERCPRCLLRPEHCPCLPLKVKRTLRPHLRRRSGQPVTRHRQGVRHARAAR